MPNTKRLYLPGGRSFDIPMPSGSSLSESVSGATEETCPNLAATVVIGAVIGGALTWLLLKLRNT